MEHETSRSLSAEGSDADLEEIDPGLDFLDEDPGLDFLGEEPPAPLGPEPSSAAETGERVRERR